MLQFPKSVEVRLGIDSWLVGWLVGWSVFWLPICLENHSKDFLAFGMKAQHDNGQKHTCPFLQEKSGSFIIHKSQIYQEEKNFLKRNWSFQGQLDFGFRKNILGSKTCEILRESLRAVIKISNCLQINFVSPRIDSQASPANFCLLQGCQRHISTKSKIETLRSYY